MASAAPSGSASPRRVPTPPTNSVRFWKKLINEKTPKRPKVNQVGRVPLSDWKYFENYKEDRGKSWRPNRELEIHAFISLQHLIIARFGQEIESGNDTIFNGLCTCNDDEECDVEMMWEAQDAMHLYCGAIDDIENMLKRRTPYIDRARRKQPEDKAYLKALTERGIELRLLDAGHPTLMTQVMTNMGGLVIGPILTQIGIVTLLVPVLLILFTLDLSKGAVVGIIIGSLAIL